MSRRLVALVASLAALTVAAEPAAAGTPASAVVHALPADEAVPQPGPVDEGVFYSRPVDGAVLRAFDPPAQRWSLGHRGVDLAASAGDEVRSPADGVVTFAGVVAGRPLVVVLHADGRRSTLEPVEPLVERGQSVLDGEALGTVPTAPTHCAPSVCLHWGVRTEDDDTYLDPLALLPGGGPIVLLPRP